MLTILFYLISFTLLISSRWFAGRWLWGYFLGGLIFGIFNEFSFEFCWNYSKAMGPTVYKDIPFLVLTGWGTIGLFAMAISDKLSVRFKRPAWARLVLDSGIYSALGIPQEAFMLHRDFWTYNFPYQAQPAIQVMGYVCCSLLMCALGRRIQALMDGKD